MISPNGFAFVNNPQTREIYYNLLILQLFYCKYIT